jgi:hypothetical protein
MWTQRWSAGMYGGYAFSTGSWKKHLYAPGVNQFNTDLSLAFSFSYKASPNLGIDFRTIYLRLNTSDWKNYVRLQGDRFDAQASCWVTPITLSFAVFQDSRNFASILGGIGLAFSGGNETFNRINYEYDFLHGVDFVFITGLDYNLILKPPIAFSMQGTLILIPSGVHYINQDPRTIIAFPITAGLRFYF